MTINYYEELNLSSEDSIVEINRALNQLESTWIRRKITVPEKATKMLALIIDARAVFATEESKYEYDNSLISASQEETDQDVSAQFVKVWAGVERFYNDGQWDLAQMAIEKAFSLMDAADLVAGEAEQVYYIAQEIYRKNCHFDQAIDITNRYISFQPDSVMPYFLKQNALLEYKEHLQKQGVDATQCINTYRTTCQIWAKIAKEQNEQADYLSATSALHLLALSYYNDPPKDIDLAEKLARKILELDPKHNGAKQIITRIYQPREVTLEERNSYRMETSEYGVDISNLVSQITMSGLVPETNKGWVLAMKSFHGFYDPYKDGTDLEESKETTYLLSPDGKFVKWVKKNTLTFYKGEGYDSKDEDHIEACPIEELMLEMDFEAWSTHRNDIGWEETSSFAGMVLGGWNAHKTQFITRLFRKKGQGLYNKLKEITDRNSSYIEECCRINAAYNRELEPLRKAISDKYSTQREQIAQEQNTQIDLARNMEPERQAAQNQIAAIGKELSSLGFFSIKRKKTLQKEIVQLEQKLNQMPTVESVKSIFQKKLDDLALQERNELQRSEQELRNKYPLPKR